MLAGIVLVYWLLGAIAGLTLLGLMILGVALLKLSALSDRVACEIIEAERHARL